MATALISNGDTLIASAAYGQCSINSFSHIQIDFLDAEVKNHQSCLPYNLEDIY